MFRKKRLTFTNTLEKMASIFYSYLRMGGKLSWSQSISLQKFENMCNFISQALIRPILFIAAFKTLFI